MCLKSEDLNALLAFPGVINHPIQNEMGAVLFVNKDDNLELCNNTGERGFILGDKHPVVESPGAVL